MTTYVKYIGLKARKDDNIAHTTAIWNGAGAIVPMRDQDAAKCLAHVDIFVTATPDEVVAAGFEAPAPTGLVEAQPKEVKAEEPIEEEADRVIHQINLQTMTKADLRQYAARSFNKELPDDMKIQEMRKQVRDLRIGAGIRNG